MSERAYAGRKFQAERSEIWVFEARCAGGGTHELTQNLSVAVLVLAGEV